ncbi:hypothetical protein NEOC95_000075 [Neochlamydia sp. AcF95]|nr:hypothetical protein [Neochlamydia sp. AcF95]
MRASNNRLWSRYCFWKSRRKDEGALLNMMNYKSALDKGLPIGSGEIESSHRHVVQKRLKIAGTWWKTENANAMLSLRIGRLNGYWEAYWNSYKAAA